MILLQKKLAPCADHVNGFSLMCTLGKAPDICAKGYYSITFIQQRLLHTSILRKKVENSIVIHTSPYVQRIQ